MWQHGVLVRMWDQIGLRCLVQTFAFERGLHFLMVSVGEVVDCTCHLVCCEYAGTRNSEPVCGRRLGWGVSDLLRTN